MGWVVLAVLAGIAALVIWFFVALFSHVDPPPDGRPETEEEMRRRVMARHENLDRARALGFDSVQEMEEAKQRFVAGPGESSYQHPNTIVPKNTDLELLPTGRQYAIVGEYYYKENIERVLQERPVGPLNSGNSVVYETAYLFSEPDNPYGRRKAVVVMMSDGEELRRVGYIASGDTLRWRKLIMAAAEEGKTVASRARFYRKVSNGKLDEVEIQLLCRKPE